MPAESWWDGVAGAATGGRDSLQDGEELLGAGGSENEGAGLVVVFRALFPSGQTSEDDGSALQAFGAVDGEASDGVAVASGGWLVQMRNAKWGIRNGGMRVGGGEEGDAVDFSEPGGRVAAGGVEHGDFVAFGEAGVDPIFHDVRTFLPFFGGVGEDVEFGLGAFGQGVLALKVADEVGGGGGFQSGDEAAELAGVADGVAEADGDGLQEVVAEAGGVEGAVAEGEALGGIVENGDGGFAALAEEPPIDAPPAGIVRAVAGVMVLRFIDDEGVVAGLETGGLDGGVEFFREGVVVEFGFFLAAE
jgi:hypothetical protein